MPTPTDSPDLPPDSMGATSSGGSLPPFDLLGAAHRAIAGATDFVLNQILGKMRSAMSVIQDCEGKIVAGVRAAQQSAADALQQSSEKAELDILGTISLAASLAREAGCGEPDPAEIYRIVSTVAPAQAPILLPALQSGVSVGAFGGVAPVVTPPLGGFTLPGLPAVPPDLVQFTSVPPPYFTPPYSITPTGLGVSYPPGVSIGYAPPGTAIVPSLPYGGSVPSTSPLVGTTGGAPIPPVAGGPVATGGPVIPAYMGGAGVVSGPSVGGGASTGGPAAGPSGGATSGGVTPPVGTGGGIGLPPPQGGSGAPTGGPAGGPPPPPTDGGSGVGGASYGSPVAGGPGAAGGPSGGGAGVTGGTAPCPPVIVSVQCPGATAVASAGGDVVIDGFGGAQSCPPCDDGDEEGGADPKRFKPPVEPGGRRRVEVEGEGDDKEKRKDFLQIERLCEDLAGFLKEARPRAKNWIAANFPDASLSPGRAWFDVALADAESRAFWARPFVFFWNIPYYGVGKLLSWFTRAQTEAGDKVPVELRLTRAVLRWVQRWVGDFVKNDIKKIDYVCDYANPTDYPSAADAHAAFAQGEIEEDEWECWVRLNNQLPEPAKKVFQTKITRLGVAEAIRLYRRGEIGEGALHGYLRAQGWFYKAEREQHISAQRITLGPADLIAAYRRGLISRDQFYARMKAEGITVENDVSLLHALSKYIPGPAEIVRFMTRDVADEKVVKRYGYDDEFDVKFAGELPGWAEAHGVDKEVMRYHWRAHWHIPALQNLYDMYHRNRPGRVPKDIEVTLDDVKQVMAINDIMPYWQQRLLNIQFALPRLIDIRASFFAGIIDRQEVLQQLQDRGYSPDNARRTADYMDRQKYIKGLQSKPAKQYLAGAVSRQEADVLLQQEGYVDPHNVNILNRLDVELGISRRAACVKALKRRFLHGEFDVGVLTRDLIGLGVDPGQTVQFIASWQCEAAARGKAIPASKLCTWAQRGIITYAVLAIRLSRLGYTPDEVAAMVAECQIVQRERARKAAAAAARAQQRDTERRAKARANQQAKAAKVAQQTQGARAKAQAKREKLFALQVRVYELAAQIKGTHQDQEKRSVDEFAAALTLKTGFSPETVYALIEQELKQAKAAKEDHYGERLGRMVAALR